MQDGAYLRDGSICCLSVGLSTGFGRQRFLLVVNLCDSYHITEFSNCYRRFPIGRNEILCGFVCYPLLSLFSDLSAVLSMFYDSVINWEFSCFISYVRGSLRE